MREIPTHDLDPGFPAGKKPSGKKKKKFLKGKERSHVTVIEPRYSPEGKLERPLKTKAETGSLHRVKFK